MLQSFLRGHWHDGDVFNRADTAMNLFWRFVFCTLRVLCSIGWVPTRSKSRFPWLHQWSDNVFSTTPLSQMDFSYTNTPHFDEGFTYLRMDGEGWMQVMQGGPEKLNLTKFLSGSGCTHPLLVSESNTGWGVTALEPILRPSPIALYIGEYFKGGSPYPDKRFDLGLHNQICITAARLGNVCRFMNHRCYGNNAAFALYTVKKPSSPYSQGLPYVYIKTTRPVRAMEPITYSYWQGDYLGNDGIECTCGHPDCWKPHFPRQ